MSHNVTIVFSANHLVFLPCRLGWPNPTAHICPTGEGRYRTTAVAARSISKCSHDFWVHPTPPFGPRGTWGCSCIPFGSWRISIHNNKGMKVSLGILLCPPTSILLTTEAKYTNHFQIRRWIFLGLFLFVVVLLLLLSCMMNGLIFKISALMAQSNNLPLGCCAGAGCKI